MANPALTEAVYYILLSLTRPLHGYGIMKKAEEMSSGRVSLAPGTLYGALNTLIAKGWIVSLPTKGESRKKEYEITDEGKKVLKGELQRLTELVNNGLLVLGGEQ